MTAAPWTPAEDVVLRERYVTDGAQACVVALGRSWAAVTQRARRLSIVRRRRWTPRDDLRLSALWGTTTIARVAAQMGRTPRTVYWRAQRLDLGLGCPEGMEYLTHAAERAGYATASLRIILRWAGVRIARAASRPDAAPRSRRLRGEWVVDPDDVDDAIARWHTTETLEGAARRRGVGSCVLVRLLGEAAARGDARVPPKPARPHAHWRVPSALVDDLLAVASRQQSVTAAARRVGVTRQTLAAWLRAAGVTVARTGVDSADVDRVVESRRLATTCRAWARRAA